MAEDIDRYSVLLVGIDGIDGGPVGAAERLAGRFKLAPKVAEKLVASIPAIVKKNVGARDAERYAEALRALGAEARIEPVGDDAAERLEPTGPVAAAAVESPLAAAPEPVVAAERAPASPPVTLADSSGDAPTAPPNIGGPDPTGHAFVAPTGATGTLLANGPASMPRSDRPWAQESDGFPTWPDSESGAALAALADESGSVPDDGPSDDAAPPMPEPDLGLASFDSFLGVSPRAEESAPVERPVDHGDPGFGPSWSVSGALPAAPGPAEPRPTLADGPRGATVRFDPAAFDVPIPKPTPATGEEPSVPPRASAGPGEAPGRPSLFDELMAIDGPVSEPVPGAGLAVGPAGFTVGAIAQPPTAPTPAAAEVPGTRLGHVAPVKMSVRAPAPEPAVPVTPQSSKVPVASVDRLNDFGTLHLSGLEDDLPVGLELDTDKPHLTGRHQAVKLPIIDHEADDDFDRPPARAVSPARGTVALSGLADAAASGASRKATRGERVAAPRSGAVRTPVGAASAESPATSGASGRIGARPAAAATGPRPHVTGGFNAQVERARRATQRFARFAVRVMLLAVVVVAATYGFVLFQGYRANAAAARFAGAPTYYEHQIRLGEATAIRACALPADSDTFVCRYSREWYEHWFPGLSPSVVERAPGVCYGSLSQSGAVHSETLDCVLRIDLGNGTIEKNRLYVNLERACDAPLVSLDPGSKTTCRSRQVATTLALRDPPPEPTEVGTEEFQYRRNVDLNTDVGTLPAREFVVHSTTAEPEYRYFSADIGLFLRRAELAGAATLRLTYLERAGQSSGTQSWSR